MFARNKRFEAAKSALIGLLADPTPRPKSRHKKESCMEATVRIAIEHGDELIRQLKK